MQFVVLVDLQRIELGPGCDGRRLQRSSAQRDQVVETREQFMRVARRLFLRAALFGDALELPIDTLRHDHRFARQIL